MPDVAAFDLDGTLTEGGSVFDFLAAVAGRPAVVVASVALSPSLAHAALVGGVVADTTKERLFGRLLAGVEVDRLDRVARSFAEQHVDRHLRSDVFRRLAWHQQRGDHVAIVSASPAAYAGPIGELLGVDQVIATGLAIEDGRLTGRYEGRNCRGEEKLRRLHQWMEDIDGTPALWAYGNSRGDLRMLGAADFGFNVGHLGRLGRLRHYAELDEPARGDRAGRF